jgi:MFS family permease
MGVMMPALQALIPEIISREQLMNATAVNTVGMNVLNLIAPVIAGFMIALFDFESVYYTTAVLYLWGAIIILFMPVRDRIISGASNIIADIQKGFQYIRRDDLVLSLLIFTLIIVVLSMPYQQLLPIFVDNILKVGAEGMGMLTGSAGLGALISSILLAALPDKKRGLMLLGSGVVTGVALLGFSFSASMSLSLVCLFLVGLGQTFRMTIGSALVQTYTQDVYMGRVMALMNMQFGFMSICTFLAGILAEVVKVQWVLGSMAIALTALALMFVIFSPGIRKVE